MATSFNSRISVAPDVMFRNLGDESVILHLGTETYLGLDPIGTRMWALLTQSDSVADAFQVLLSEYDVDQAQLHRDLDEFIAKLLENELIQIHNAEPVPSGA